ncbi:hypothetical protein G3O08_20665, partial [Cryomorpha ignava]
MKKEYRNFLKICWSLCLFMTLATGAFAQVTHQVTVQNFEFSPADLVINEGDIVQWTNIGGFHNVDGTFETYPGNTESFGNDPGGAGWTYSYQFTTAGVNDYRCAIHPSSMVASVTVVAAFDCPDLEANFGDACDDGNSNTGADIITEGCECVGIPIFDCNELEANI